MRKLLEWLIRFTQRILDRKRADIAARRARLPALRYTDFMRYSVEADYLDMLEARMKDVEKHVTNLSRLISKDSDPSAADG